MSETKQPASRGLMTIRLKFPDGQIVGCDLDVDMPTLRLDKPQLDRTMRLLTSSNDWTGRMMDIARVALFNIGSQTLTITHSEAPS